MNPSVKNLTEQAMALPVAEREKLASSLLETTHNKELTDNDQLWISVSEERYADLVSGKDGGIPESDFFEKVEQKLQWK